MPPEPTPPAAPFPVTPIHPDLLAWARQTLDLEEFMREVREIEAGGGCTLESFIDEVEARATRS